MTDKPECACGNCSWQGSTNDVEDIRDIWSRIEAGDTFPAGECPDCGCFAYMIETPKITLREASLMVALNDLLGAAYNVTAYPTGDTLAALQHARDTALTTVAALFPGEESHGEVTQAKT